MDKLVLKVEGMMCGMCESHVNSAVRKAFPVKKVTSSHKKQETVILSERNIDETTLRRVINETGYTVRSIRREPCEKGHFSLFGR